MASGAERKAAAENWRGAYPEAKNSQGAPMQFLRFLIWTSASVLFGIFLGSADLGGKTPVQHMQRLWERHGDQVKEGVRDALLTENETTPPPARAPVKPRDSYSAEERDAVNRLVAKRTGQK
jgi:hypothetical protein